MPRKGWNRYLRYCKRCGEVFKANAKHSKVCTDCNKLNNHLNCEVCGLLFVRKNNSQLTCSYTCQRVKTNLFKNISKNLYDVCKRCKVKLKSENKRVGSHFCTACIKHYRGNNAKVGYCGYQRTKTQKCMNRVMEGLKCYHHRDLED
jgi:hypothetical protein